DDPNEPSESPADRTRCDIRKHGSASEHQPSKQCGKHCIDQTDGQTMQAGLNKSWLLTPVKYLANGCQQYTECDCGATAKCDSVSPSRRHLPHDGKRQRRQADE